MRRKFLLLFGFAAVVVASCTQDNMSEPTAEMTGELILSLDTEGMITLSKASIEVGVPEPEDLTVEIFKKTDLENVRLYRDTYSKIKEKPVKLNCADYRMLAYYGDSLAVGEDLAYYECMADFSLTPQERSVNVSATAKVSNVRVAVEYGENLEHDYTEYYSVVRSVTPGGRRKTLEFYQDEGNKKAFVPYGTLYFELYAKVDGQWKYFPSKAVEPLRGDDITFKVDTKRLTGQQGITVTIAQLDKKEISYEVSADMLPQDAPEASAGNIPTETEMVEGDPAKTNLRMDFVVDGNIKECWLNVNSAYLAAMGVPERVDLASDNLSTRVKNALESVGLKWMNGMAGRRFAYLDFSGITRFMGETVCDPDNLFSADFSVEIIDQRNNPGQTSHVGTYKSKTYTFVQGVPAPTLSVNGFENGAIEILEGMGVTYDGLKAKVVAKGRIGHCYLYITSPYMVAAGVPSRVDLSTADETTVQKLRSFGISWPRDIALLTEAEIDFSGVTDYMDGAMYSATRGESFASFRLTVENEVYLTNAYKTASSDVGAFKYTLPAATVSTIQSHNVWAKKIYDFSVNLTTGNPKHLKLQYSTDNSTWVDINENTTLDGTVLSCSKLPTEPNTLYNIRAIYHDNPDLWIGFTPVTTEAAAQIPNSDFEGFTEQSFRFEKVLAISYGYSTQKWWTPSCGCWDVNSKKTMPSSTTPEYLTYKVFPTVSYTVNNAWSGKGKSAQIMTVAIGSGSTSSTWVGSDRVKVAGELFIGKSDASGNHESEGYPFTSRPSKISFKYQYLPVANERFVCEIRLSLKDKVIAKKYLGSASSSWTTATVDLTDIPEYSNSGTQKANSIYISFKSSDSSDLDFSMGTSLELAGENYKFHCGSVLRIDDLQLIYE